MKCAPVSLCKVRSGGLLVCPHAPAKEPLGASEALLTGSWVRPQPPLVTKRGCRDPSSYPHHGPSEDFDWLGDCTDLRLQKLESDVLGWTADPLL